jgi:FkbM family methyltransferase
MIRSMTLRKGMGWCRRVYYLRRLMSTWDAVRLISRENARGDIEFHLHKTGSSIVLRGATTDIKCFEKVFLANEYQSPFPLAPQLVVDAGANVGMATLYFAHKYPDATIVAIEPEPANFRILQRNCGRLRNVVLIQAALWPEHRKLKINDHNSDAWTFSVSEEQSDAAAEVVAITVDEILGRFGARQIDLLKLDIEGAELDLFSRGGDGWMDRVRCIVIELHDRLRAGSSRAFYSQLVSHEFAQEVRGENIFVRLGQAEEPNASDFSFAAALAEKSP